MTRRPTVRALRRGAVVVTVALAAAGLAGCSSSAKGPSDVLAAIDARQQAAAQAVAPAAGAEAAAAAKCSPAADASFPRLASLPSPSSLPPASLMAKIRNRGSLVVGVAGDTRLLGARDRLTDDAPRGFDIAIAESIGRAIFGSDGHVTFKVITAGQRFPQVNAGADGNKGGVDLVARAVSMTCDRWAATDPAKGSAFSVAYLLSDQRVLVRKGVASLAALVRSRTDAGATARVCAPAASTSIAKITGMKGVTAVPVAIHSDCLALWQEGRVDAITGDDVILAGFQAQDQTAVILGGDQNKLDTTPYGLAISQDHAEFVQFVNTYMATPQFRQDWQQAYQEFLDAPLSQAPKQLPVPNYSRPVK